MDYMRLSQKPESKTKQNENQFKPKLKKKKKNNPWPMMLSLIKSCSSHHFLLKIYKGKCRYIGSATIWRKSHASSSILSSNKHFCRHCELHRTDSSKATQVAYSRGRQKAIFALYLRREKYWHSPRPINWESRNSNF